jgi:DNA-directed RNA polymerase specialized sigma subunit
MFNDHDILVAVNTAAKAAWHVGHGRLNHDDCVSEANEAVALAMRSYDPAKGASLSTYAATRARWQAKKLLDVQGRNRNMPSEWFEHVPTWPLATLEEMFEGMELQVVSLWLDHGLTYREIADQLDMTVFHIFGIMQRVKKKLLKRTEMAERKSGQVPGSATYARCN